MRNNVLAMTALTLLFWFIAVWTLVTDGFVVWIWYLTLGSMYTTLLATDDEELLNGSTGHALAFYFALVPGWLPFQIWYLSKNVRRALTKLE